MNPGLPNLFRAARHRTLIAAVILAGAGIAGCSLSRLPFSPGGSALTMHSRADAEMRLTARFDRAVYSFDGKDAITMVLTAGPEQEPTHAATVRVFWRPRAGRTPVSSQATNATIQYIILPASDSGDGEVGVYSGAGFVFPRTKPGSTFEAGVWDATLLLSEQSEGFTDRLGQSTLRGEIVARRDDAAAGTMLKRLSERVTQRLGYPRFVAAD